ncbi:PdaC/SigV domain-containing protein [Paenibacillus pini]|uniref:Uncharacterized protein n=1 Tax=Paenibacillus pini JCM 16418 TaxID=1236976 RepID=W7YE29_9BACL|nr:DUF4163 domain-containing protein [Paenibacillus pini]GAF09170.1 hypothetical protein JCM16418_3290 [Paenibacillus pini JCM 16418]
MNKGMKWSAGLLAAGVLVTSAGMTGGISVSAASASKAVVKQNVQPSVLLTYKGKSIKQEGRIVNGKTMIPVTVLRDAMGLALTYNPATKSYIVGSGSKKLNLEVSDYGVNPTFNGYYVSNYGNDVDAKIIEGRLYVPFTLLSDYMGYQGVYNPSLKKLDITPRVQNAIDIKLQTISKTDKNSTLLAHYPMITGLADEQAQQTINDALKKQAQTFAEESASAAKKRVGTIEPTYDFIQNYLVTYNSNGVISLITDQYSYTGGAHGMTNRVGMTFSLKDGKQLELADLLKATPDYKQKLNKIIMDKTKKDPNVFDKQEGFKSLKDKPDFYVKENGLAIFFQQYEIAPYASGFPTYIIPFGDILPKGTNPFAIAK